MCVCVCVCVCVCMRERIEQSLVWLPLFLPPSFLPFTRVDRAVSRVYRLALQDFTNSRLTSSCAAFMEMLERDSRLLRIDVQAALRITKYTSGHEDAQRPCMRRHGAYYVHVHACTTLAVYCSIETCTVCVILLYIVCAFVFS